MLFSATSSCSLCCAQLVLPLAQELVLLRQLGIEVLALGHVLMRRHPAASRPRPDRDQDGAAVAQPLGQMRDLASGQMQAQHLQLALRRLVAVEPVGRAALDDAAQWRAGHHVIGRQAVHLGEAGVGDDEALVGVEHGEALEHVGQCRVEQHVLPPEAGVGLAQIADRAVQHLERENREREVRGNAERQGGDGDQGGFPQEGAEAGDDHGPADHVAVDQDRHATGVGRSQRALRPAPATMAALLIPDALQDGRGHRCRAARAPGQPGSIDTPARRVGGDEMLYARARSPRP